MKLGCIGYGNLSKAFVKGLLHSDFFQTHTLAVHAKSKETLDYAQEQGFETFSDAQQLVDACDIIIFGVNSLGYEDLLKKGLRIENKPIVSFLAGRTCQQIESEFNNHCVIRVIPNIAMAVQESLSSIAWGSEAPESVREEVRVIFERLGTIIETDEEGLDALTVLSSSGIAFAAKLIDGLRLKGEAYGFSNAEAMAVAKQTFLGALGLMDDTMDAQGLMHRVATKGGATYEGLVSYEKNNIDQITADAVDACYEKIMRFKEGKDLH